MVFCTFLQLKLKPNINPSHVPSLQHLQHPLQENSSTIRSRITLQYRSIRKSEWLGSMVPSTSTWSDVIWRFLLVVGRTAWRCLHKRFFQKHSIIRSCHMMSPCPSRPLAAKKLVPIWSHFPCPLLQSVVKFFRIPTKFTLNQQIHRAGVMSSMFQDKLLTDWWGPLGWQFWWGPFAFTNGLKRQYTWLLRRPGLSSTNLFLGLHGQAAFDLCPLNQWWEKKH